MGLLTLDEESAADAISRRVLHNCSRESLERIDFTDYTKASANRCVSAINQYTRQFTLRGNSA